MSFETSKALTRVVGSFAPNLRPDYAKHTHTHTHTFLHTRTQQLRVVPDEKILGGGGSGFEGKALYFGGRGVAELFFFFCCCCCCFVFFNSVGSWLL